MSHARREPDLCLGGAAAQDRQVGQYRVAQRRFAQAFHRGNQGGGSLAVAGGDQGVDRAGEPLVALKRVAV